MSETESVEVKNVKTSVRTIDIVQKGLAKRYRAERRFRVYGLAAIVASLLCLAILFINIVGNGYTAFQQTYIQLDVFFDPEKVEQGNLSTADFPGLLKNENRARNLAIFSQVIHVGANPPLMGVLFRPAVDDIDLLRTHAQRGAGGIERCMLCQFGDRCSYQSGRRSLCPGRGLDRIDA